MHVLACGSSRCVVESGDHILECARDGLAGEGGERERESSSTHTSRYSYCSRTVRESIVVGLSSGSGREEFAAVAGTRIGTGTGNKNKNKMRSAPRERDVREAVPGHREHLHDAEDEREPRDVQLHTQCNAHQ